MTLLFLNVGFGFVDNIFSSLNLFCLCYLNVFYTFVVGGRFVVRGSVNAEFLRGACKKAITGLEQDAGWLDNQMETLIAVVVSPWSSVVA